MINLRINVSNSFDSATFDFCEFETKLTASEIVLIDYCILFRAERIK